MNLTDFKKWLSDNKDVVLVSAGVTLGSAITYTICYRILGENGLSIGQHVQELSKSGDELFLKRGEEIIHVATRK